MIKSYSSFSGIALILGRDAKVDYDGAILTIEMPPELLGDFFRAVGPKSGSVQYMPVYSIISGDAEREKEEHAADSKKGGNGAGKSQEIQDTAAYVDVGAVPGRADLSREDIRDIGNALDVASTTTFADLSREAICDIGKQLDDVVKAVQTPEPVPEALPQQLTTIEELVEEEPAPVKRGPGRPRKNLEQPPPPAKAAKKQRAADPDIDDEDEPVIDNAWRCVPKDVLRLWMGCKVVPEFVRTGLVAKDLSKEWYEVVVAARREELAAAKEVAEKGTTTKLDELTSRVGHPVIGFTGTTCPTCGMAQIWCVSGVTCSNEHGFAEPNIPAPKPQKSPPPGKKSPDVEVLRLAKTLRNVIEHLKGCGYQTADEMFEACESVRDKVPVLQKIADLQLRLPRALEVLKAEAETRANASLQ